MTQDELRLVLEALYPIAHNTTDDPRGQAYKAITAIKEVLAQPEQEPVAWLDGPHLVVRSDMRERLNYKGPWVDLGRAIPDKWTPLLYTTPPQRTWVGSGDLEDSNAYFTQPQRTWVGLTNNELQPIADEYRILFGGWVEDFARAIEAKLKEKNI